MNKYEQEAADIEFTASKRSYMGGLGAGEWEAVLNKEEITRLIELGKMGYGTWGKEPSTLQYRIESMSKGV
jgi:hypothetical protein